MVILKGQQMKLRLPKREAGRSETGAFLVQCCVVFDQSIPALRTGFIIAGLVAAAAAGGKIADFLFVTGLILHLSISFEEWWLTKRVR
jgi:hypothetical protein